MGERIRMLEALSEHFKRTSTCLFSPLPFYYPTSFFLLWSGRPSLVFLSQQKWQNTWLNYFNKISDWGRWYRWGWSSFDIQLLLVVSEVWAVWMKRWPLSQRGSVLTTVAQRLHDWSILSIAFNFSKKAPQLHRKNNDNFITFSLKSFSGFMS